MYVIIISILIVLVILFWSTIKVMLKTMTSSNLENGYLWFFSLLIINIFVISILVGFYKYKKNQKGNQGTIGAAGFSGQQGDECFFENKCP